MEWLEWVIKITGAITAVAGIIFGVWKIIKAIANLVRKIDAVSETMVDLTKHSHENYLGIKRLTVMSHDMPLGERIIAGNDYIKAGGNGEVKIYIETELHTKEIQD